MSTTTQLARIFSVLGDSWHQTTRKNVYSDIQLLMDFGLDVICIKSTQNRYFVGSRLLELPELKLLVDAVESSHLITEKKKHRPH